MVDAPYSKVLAQSLRKLDQLASPLLVILSCVLLFFYMLLQSFLSSFFIPFLAQECNKRRLQLQTVQEHWSQ